MSFETKSGEPVSIITVSESVVGVDSGLSINSLKAFWINYYDARGLSEYSIAEQEGPCQVSLNCH